MGMIWRRKGERGEGRGNSAHSLPTELLLTDNITSTSLPSILPYVLLYFSLHLPFFHIFYVSAHAPFYFFIHKFINNACTIKLLFHSFNQIIIPSLIYHISNIITPTNKTS